MTTFLRQLNIDVRRNVGLLFLPLIVLGAWIVLDSLFWTTFLWSQTNRILPEAFLPFACPAIAAAAAWMGSRERRSGIEDLLASTAMPAARRQTTVLLATAIWGIVAFAVFATYVLGQTVTQATWGGPEVMPLVIGIFAILAHSGWGYLAGRILPSRFTAPIAGVAALGIQQLAAQHRHVYETGASSSTWVNELAAHNGDSGQHIVFYLGIFALSLALLYSRQLSHLASAGAVTLAAGVVLAGVVLTWGLYPDVGVEAGRLDTTGEIVYRNNFGQRVAYVDVFRAEPVCVGDPVTVCTHPAYQPVLDRAIEDAADLVEPLLGLPGVPLRIEADEVSLHGGKLDDAYLSFPQYVDRLVADEDTLHHVFQHVENDAQIAIHEWLLKRSGWLQFSMCGDGYSYRGVNGWPSSETCAVVERFEGLSKVEQRAWLEAHYQDLRQGRLTLDDLP